MIVKHSKPLQPFAGRRGFYIRKCETRTGCISNLYFKTKNNTMERKISFGDLQKAVTEAYEQFKTVSDGQVDPRVEGVDTDKFGIAVVLPSGETITVGDTSVASPMGSISKVPALTTLFEQVKPAEFIGKNAPCGCSCGGSKSAKPHIGVSAKGVRLVSAIQPQGDPDGKMDIFVSTLESLVGSEPVLNDKLYRDLVKKTEELNAVNALAAAQFELFDDSVPSIDMYAKISALTLTATQYATMAATIAADGYNPVTGGNVFDGEIAKNIVGFMAAKGPHKMAKPWLASTGLPAVSSFGGVIMGVLPGTFGIAAYSPLVNGHGVSVRAKKALAYIMQKLDLSALSSSRVTVVKD